MHTITALSYASVPVMRTTLNLDEDLLRDAQQITRISEKTAVVHAGLRAIIAREAALQLAAMGGSDRRAKAAPRRRSAASPE